MPRPPSLQPYYQKLDSISRKRYGLPGNVLLAKLEKGESGGRGNAVSGAGARGWYQFMPGTRQEVVRKFGIDPWRSEKEARDAAVLHLTGALGHNPGLEGYNPGGGSQYVRYILGQKVGKVPGQPQPRTTAPQAPGVQTPPTQMTPGAAISSAVQMPERVLGGVSPPVAPQFAAQVVQPSGYTPAPGVNPAPGPDLRQQLQESLTRNAPAPYEPPVVPVTTPQSAAGTVERRPDTGLNYGRVVVAPGANRSGVTLQKPIVNFLRKAAGHAGKPIQVTTGTSHNQYVAGTNRVSDHWAGNAVDIAVPVDSARGDLVAESAFRAAGIGAKKARQMARQGGLYNLNVNGRRLQVIWKTNAGGNHHDHVHIGYR